MGRKPCCEKVGLKRGPWTIDEDQKLINFILNNGIQCWRLVPSLAGLMRCGKSCRLRWTNYLRPGLKRGALSEAEEDQIIQLHKRLGNRWSKIASYFPGRTDNEIKNHWNTRIKKRLKSLGVDPTTHQPIPHSEFRAGSKNDDDRGTKTERPQEQDVINSEASSLANATSHEELPQTKEMTCAEGELIMWGSSDMHSPADLSYSCAKSFSLDDALHASSVAADSYTEVATSLGWVEELPSIPTWEELYHLESIFSFGSSP